MPLNLNNNEVTGVDLNNTEVSEVRLNGQTVFQAVQPFGVSDLDVWYPLNEGSGTSVNDANGNFDANLTDNQWRNDSRLVGGTGAEFIGGTNDLLQSNSTIDLDTVHNSVFSMCGWFIPDNTSMQNSIPFGITDGFEVNNNRAVVAMIVGGDDLIIAETSTADQSGGGSVSNVINQNSLLFVGITANPSSFQLFVYDSNGLIGSDFNSSNESWEGDNMILIAGARWGASTGFDGVVGAVGYKFGQELTQTEFDNIHNQTKP